jgi:hypothetical protein
MNGLRRFGLTDISPGYFLRDITEENIANRITLKKADRIPVRDHMKRWKQAEIRDGFQIKKNHK